MSGSEISISSFCYTYVLESLSDYSLYIGFTTDLRDRIDQHNKGRNFSTKSKMPWKLIYYESCLDEDDAKRREKYLKTNQGARLLKLRLKQYFYKRKQKNRNSTT